MPGEQSAHKREAHARDGIPLAPTLLRTLDAFADELGIARLVR